MTKEEILKAILTNPNLVIHIQQGEVVVQGSYSDSTLGSHMRLDEFMSKALTDIEKGMK